MKERKYIKIRGANEHNLKHLDIDIPRNEFVVLTGLSGSENPPHWHLIRSMQKDNGVIWNPCPPMPDSF